MVHVSNFLCVVSISLLRTFLSVLFSLVQSCFTYARARALSLSLSFSLPRSCPFRLFASGLSLSQQLGHKGLESHGSFWLTVLKSDTANIETRIESFSLFFSLSQTHAHTENHKIHLNFKSIFLYIHIFF